MVTARKSLQGASVTHRSAARRAGLSRQQAVVKAAAGTGKGDLEMVTLKDGDDYAEVRALPIVVLMRATQPRHRGSFRELS